MKKSAKMTLGVIGIIVVSLATVIITLSLLKTKTYTVSFVTNGGSEVTLQEVKKGENAAKPINPTKEGYTFEGWYLDGEKYYFDKPVSKDLVLEAKWVKKETSVKVTVTFDTKGAGTIQKIVTSKGETIKKPTDPVKDGYRFMGWMLNNNAFDFDNPIMNDITLVAKWEKIIKVTVKFDTKGGSAIKDQIIEKGTKLTKPADPKRNGYTFTGWTLNGKTYDFNSKVVGDMTLIATWKEKTNTSESEKKTYTVSFNTDGGNSILSQTIIEGDEASKPADPVKEGYKFLGWTLGGKSYDFNSKVTKNITLVAEWEQLKFTVTFKSNGQTLSTQTVVYGGTVTKPADPTKGGYIFSGWTLNGKTYDFNSLVEGNITLVANWTQNTYTVKVTAEDDYTIARILTVYENGVNITNTVKEIKYTNGTYLCSGTYPQVNYKILSGQTELLLVLNDNTQVTAKIS